MQIVKLNFIVSALFASGNTTFRSPFLHLILKRMPLCLIFTNSEKWILSYKIQLNRYRVQERHSSQDQFKFEHPVESQSLFYQVPM